MIPGVSRANELEQQKRDQLRKRRKRMLTFEDEAVQPGMPRIDVRVNELQKCIPAAAWMRTGGLTGMKNTGSETWRARAKAIRLPCGG